MKVSGYGNFVCELITARPYASAVYAVVVCTRLSARLSQAGNCIETTGRIELGFLAWIGLSFTYSRMFFKEIWVSRKYYVTFLWDLVPNSGLRKFRHSKSIALSTKLVVVVDGRACSRHLYDSRRVVAVYNGSVSCNPLTPLLWFLCGFVVQLVCTVDKILSAEAWELLVLT